jgi:hypothetical protein
MTDPTSVRDLVMEAEMHPPSWTIRIDRPVASSLVRRVWALSEGTRCRPTNIRSFGGNNDEVGCSVSTIAESDELQRISIDIDIQFDNCTKRNSINRVTGMRGSKGRSSSRRSDVL